jgi:hypothetical protein
MASEAVESPARYFVAPHFGPEFRVELTAGEYENLVKGISEETQINRLNQLLAYQEEAAGDEIGDSVNILKSLDDYVAYLHSKNRNLESFASRRVAY